MLYQQLSSAIAFALQVSADQSVAECGVAEFLLVHALCDSCERLVTASHPFETHVSALAIGEEAEQTVLKPILGLVAHLENVDRHRRRHEAVVDFYPEVVEQLHPVTRVTNLVGPECGV